jgi:hypothetical protein
MYNSIIKLYIEAPFVARLGDFTKPSTFTQHQGLCQVTKFRGFFFFTCAHSLRLAVGVCTARHLLSLLICNVFSLCNYNQLVPDRVCTVRTHWMGTVRK